jgi:hypothetical protein
MTAFGNLLDDEQIAAVLTYLRTSPDYANNSVPVDPAIVTTVRAEYGSRSEAWTQVELEAIHGAVGNWTPPPPPEETTPVAEPAGGEA